MATDARIQCGQQGHTWWARGSGAIHALRLAFILCLAVGASACASDDSDPGFDPFVFDRPQASGGTRGPQTADEVAPETQAPENQRRAPIASQVPPAAGNAMPVPTYGSPAGVAPAGVADATYTGNSAPLYGDTPPGLIGGGTLPGQAAPPPDVGFPRAAPPNGTPPIPPPPSTPLPSLGDPATAPASIPTPGSPPPTAVPPAIPPATRPNFTTPPQPSPSIATPVTTPPIQPPAGAAQDLGLPPPPLPPLER